MKGFYVVGLGLFLIVLLWPIVLYPSLKSFLLSPYDSSVGRVEKLEKKELEKSFQGQKILIVGASRGLGFGVASVLAEFADITIVGRNKISGEEALQKLKSINPEKNHKFYEGDIGSVRKAKELVQKLAKEEEKWDNLIVSAGIFPDWDHPFQEDGVNKVFAVDVLGRYILYRESDKYLKKRSRIVDILAPTQNHFLELDREIILGLKNATSLFSAMLQFSIASELMLIGLTEEFERDRDVISLHPGVVKTELHRGQGVFFDLLAHLMYFVQGISLEESGNRIASILASQKLHKKGLTFVDFDMDVRTRSTGLQDAVDKHQNWLMIFLDTLFSAPPDPPKK